MTWADGPLGAELIEGTSVFTGIDEPSMLLATAEGALPPATGTDEITVTGQ